MKSILRAAATIFFLAVLSTSAILSLRLSQRDGQFKATQAGFNLLIQLHAATLDQGFFSWTKLKDLVAHHEVSEAELLLQDVYTTYPFIKETIILPRDKPVSAYEIVGSGTTLQLSFSLKDDLGKYPLPGWAGVISIDAQKLLDAYNPENKLVIAVEGERELGYSIHVNFSNPLLSWMDQGIRQG